MKPSENEEEYFARQELERRKRAAEEKARAMAGDEKARLKELHYMKCPKCGMDLEHFELKGIELDRCVSCGGTWFDQGELEEISGGDDKGVLGKISSIFR